MVRNKRTHFYELSAEAQKQMGSMPDGFLRCFAVLLECSLLMSTHGLESSHQCSWKFLWSVALLLL